jgi:hypothetical protein
MAASNRSPAPLEKGRARPQHDRRGQHGLHKVRQHRRDQMMQGRHDMPAHFQHEHRQGQHRGEKEPATHIEIFGARTAVEGCLFRLQRHAADGARAGILPHLWVHGANPDGSCGRLRRFRRCEIALRIGEEFRAATGAAEMIVMTGMGCMMRAGQGIDHHAADRIMHGSTLPGPGFLGSVILSMMACVVRFRHRSPPCNCGKAIDPGRPCLPILSERTFPCSTRLSQSKAPDGDRHFAAAWSARVLCPPHSVKT